MAWCSIPQAFLDEVAKLQGQGVAISPENLRVAENVTLILPLHRELDALRESSNCGHRDRHHPPRHRTRL